MHQAKGIKSSATELKSSEGEFVPGNVFQEAGQGKVSGSQGYSLVPCSGPILGNIFSNAGSDLR